MRRSRWLAAAAAGTVGVGAALGAGACGGGDEVPATITTNLPGGVSVASTPSTAAPAPAPAPTTPPTASTPTGETAPGGGGDEQGTRVPATFLLRGSKLTPPSVTIPAFLATEVTINSADPKPHTVMIKVGKGYSLSVPAKGNNTVRVPGQKSGRFPVLVDGKAGGTITWGGEPGP